MNIVECGMCLSLHQIEDWKESDIFICKICANILSEIRREEIELEKEGIKLSKYNRLAEFDIRRAKVRDD